MSTIANGNSSITGKVALITGGTTGIGLATAKKLAQAGAKVVIAGRNAEKGAAALKQLEEVSDDVRFIQTDVAEANDVEHLINTTIATFGGLDLAFNNAGIESLGPLGDTSEETWDQVIDVNLKGVWLSMKHEIAHMLPNGGGVIVNTSSVAGSKGMAGLSAYVASKHGVNGLTKALALEYAEAGIRINAVLPGPIETPMMDRVSSVMPGAADMFTAVTAMKRTGQPQEIADAVVWLLSDESSYVTGATIPVDGGMLAL